MEVRRYISQEGIGMEKQEYKVVGIRWLEVAEITQLLVGLGITGELKKTYVQK